MLIKPGPDFRRFFQTFEHAAFRLEVRDRYDAPYENESVRKFLAGEPDGLEWANSWLRLVREGRAEGRTFSRVRVVSLPLTDYSRFGLWVSQFTVEAGEDIRYVARDEAADLPSHDYWMFDSRTVIRMHFDDESVFLGGEIIDDPAEVVQHNYWRDAAWHKAVRREDFATDYGG
ncbi:DUF6879 family protein [Amycolatopsis nigrescens]|uniref:DUF6879 family protein n=1 Tax=Amycolatopsis nigrescens TaxID=381445 RepID=UPI00035D7E4A|nr:DUF6879 family protein [Amycolatopsis nigrescens]